MYKRIVVKLGTSVLTSGQQSLDRAHMVELVRQCAQIHNTGADVILCSSGAIAAGRERYDLSFQPTSLAEKQMLAAIGQSRLMYVWEQLFDLYDIHVGQVLLTREDVQDRNRFLNARDTMTALLSHRIVPIINENDAVATNEIKVGDNDNLSALVSLLTESDALLLLTDQPGLFTADPRKNPEAALIPEVNTINESLQELAGSSVSGLGVGGMATKLQAADVARRAGTDVHIASGHAPQIIQRLASGEKVGTYFPSLDSPLVNKKRWILAGPVPAGDVVVDAGAKNALVLKGKSLLPSGIIKTRGSFDRGDTVRICALDGQDMGRGITRYNREEVDAIKGLHSDEIENRLGYAYGPVVVHRNDLILTY